MGLSPADSLCLVFKKTGSFKSKQKCLIDVSLLDELVTEILVRHPVKSLLKFKRVSKSWLSLISDPQFIRYHLSISSSMEAESLNLQFLFATEASMKMCCLYSALHEADPSTHVSAIEFACQNMRSIVGIINGLVCLNLKGIDLCVWNPALNKIKHLNVYPQAPAGRRFVEYCFSFGYDESTDDYKVVCLQTDGGASDAEVGIYSLKADSWRMINQMKWFHSYYPGVFANGKIYWSDYIYSNPNLKNVSLDMSSEKFAEMQPPEYDAGYYELKTGVSGGRLFVYSDYFYREKKADLWVLDKRGVEESWCKLVSIPYTDDRGKLWDFNYRVLYILSNGEIVFGGPCGLIVYDWKKKEYRDIKLDVGATSWRIAAYVESLVWPN